MPQIMAAGSDDPADGKTRANDGVVLAAPMPSESRGAQVDRLARGTAAEVLQAVKILVACKNVEPYTRAAQQAEDPKIKRLLQQMVPTTNCDGLSPGQRTELVPLAIKAAQGHAPGSFAQLMVLVLEDKSVANDPLVQQAWGDIIASNLQAATPDAPMARYLSESNCGDPPKCTGQDLSMALVHWTTYVDAKGGTLKWGDTVTPLLVKALGPDAAQTAIAQGHAAYANRSQQ